MSNPSQRGSRYTLTTPPFEFVNRQTALISEEGEVIKVMENETIHRDDRFMVKATDP